MSKARRVLVIDDEPDIRELLEITLGRMGLDTIAAGDCKSARRLLKEEEFDLCLTDLKLPDGDGIELVKAVQELDYALPVAVFTAHGNTDTAITAMKAGAYDFVSKPVNLEQLRALVHSALEVKSKAAKSTKDKGPGFVGESSVTKQLKKQIRKLAQSQAPIYISGESGSGKEVVARSIHYQGPRAEGPFIPVNCGAIPAELMESEFFGHKKGAFTGAHQDKIGLFQAADGGTLFLDEVADLPLDMQVKLLRAIQEKAIRPVGAQAEISINVRVLSATHKDLQAEVASQRFRSDLFYRINVIEVSVPALRERKEDIAALCDYFLSRIANDIGLDPATLSEKAKQRLHNYHFPGNVRELENILERAFTLCEDDVIHESDLFISEAPSSPTTPSKQKHALEGRSLDDYLIEIEKEFLLSALEECRWNKTAAAESLGITFRSFRYRLKKLGLEDA
ncbi:sigma-54-dependent transcriptional regulator [Pseudoteredinibacter isoporae]|uniref:sigma-54-dependent transcriptional regulator n=1 Tax=Pseudoteredinibacter isoporae TaxID=570281 RepID=UPI00310C5791